jgi:hypothetical protein
VAIEGTKSEGVFESLDLGDNVIPYPEFDSVAVAAAIEEAVRAGAKQRLEIADRITQARTRLRNVRSLLREVVLSPDWSSELADGRVRSTTSSRDARR